MVRIDKLIDIIIQIQTGAGANDAFDLRKEFIDVKVLGKGNIFKGNLSINTLDDIYFQT